MFSALRALVNSAKGSEPLPEIPELAELYRWGCRPRRGEIIMIAGRSGSQKSGFALWLCSNWNLPTLYFAGDMSEFQASSRLASMRLDKTTHEIQQTLTGLGSHDADGVRNVLQDSNIDFSFDSPITSRGIEAELEAYVEIHNTFPEVIVIDNFMDIAGCESDYNAQMQAFQELTALARHTKATMLVLHHATDKGEKTANVHDLAHPPARRDIKGGMSEKPELIFTVAIASDGSNIFRVAVVKQRMGKSDPAAHDPVPLQAVPEYTRFEPHIRKSEEVAA